MAVQIAGTTKPGSSGGMPIGAILGTIGAGIAAIPSGGASLAAIPAIAGAASAGGAIGGSIGGAIAPGSGAVNDGTPQSDSAMSRRMQQIDDSDLRALRDAATSLPQLPPELRQQATAPILTAYAQAYHSRGGT